MTAPLPINRGTFLNRFEFSIFFSVWSTILKTASAMCAIVRPIYNQPGTERGWLLPPAGIGPESKVFFKLHEFFWRLWKIDSRIWESLEIFCNVTSKNGLSRESLPVLCIKPFNFITWVSRAYYSYIQDKNSIFPGFYFRKLFLLPTVSTFYCVYLLLFLLFTVSSSYCFYLLLLLLPTVSTSHCFNFLARL